MKQDKNKVIDGVSASAVESMRQPSASEKQTSQRDEGFAELLGRSREKTPRADFNRNNKQSQASNQNEAPADPVDAANTSPSDTSEQAPTELIQLAHIQTQFATKTLAPTTATTRTQPGQQLSQTGLSVSGAPAQTGETTTAADTEISNNLKKILGSANPQQQNTAPQKVSFSDALAALRGETLQRAEQPVQPAQSGNSQNQAGSAAASQSTATSSSAVTGVVAGSEIKPALTVPTNSTPPPPSLMSDASLELSGDATSLEQVESSDIQSATRTTNSEGMRAQSPAAVRQASPTVFQTWTNIIHRFDGKGQRFEIRLDPAELGKIDVKIEITQENKAQIVLAARSAEALAELNRGARSLEVTLSESGVELAENGLSFELAQDDTPQDKDENDDLPLGQIAEEDTETENSEEISQKPAETGEELTVWTRLRVNLRA